MSDFLSALNHAVMAATSPTAPSKANVAVMKAPAKATPPVAEPKTYPPHSTWTPSKHPADPRSDLAKDHLLWEVVLTEAWRPEHQDPDGWRRTYGLLHGLRCGGALLEVRDNGSLFLDYDPLIDLVGDVFHGNHFAGWTRWELKEKWLEPQRPGIVRVFSRVARIWEQMQKVGITS